MYTKTIYFSGGDPRELQAVFDMVPGVTQTRVGRLTGTEPGDVHGVEVVYNPKKTDLSMLMDLLFTVVTPHRPDGQGRARGSEYRCAVWYSDAEDLPHLQLYVHFLASRKKPPQITGDTVTINVPEVDPKLFLPCYVVVEELTAFHEAPEEDQHYYETHPKDDSFINLKGLESSLEF